jgi:allantoin racemase
LRSVCSVPIVGLAEAALRRANATGEPFAIVTAGANWVDLQRDRADSFGLATRLNGVYALDGNGAALQKAPELFREQVHALSVRAADAAARTLILGGAAFAGLDFAVEARLMLLDVYQIASDALKQASGMRHNNGQDGLADTAQLNEVGKPS